jgi:hypothetical protein
MNKTKRPSDELTATLNIRLSKRTKDRVEALAPRLGWSENLFFVSAVEAVLDIIDQKKEPLACPEMIALARYAKYDLKSPKLRSTKVTEADLERVQQSQPKRGRRSKNSAAA